MVSWPLSLSKQKVSMPIRCLCIVFSVCRDCRAILLQLIESLSLKPQTQSQASVKVAEKKVESQGFSSVALKITRDIETLSPRKAYLFQGSLRQITIRSPK